MFPDLDVTSLKIKLVRGGAPADFMLHTFRHTVATWLETAGRSEWERGLVLNHSGSGVTAIDRCVTLPARSLALTV